MNKLTKACGAVGAFLAGFSLMVGIAFAEVTDMDAIGAEYSDAKNEVVDFIKVVVVGILIGFLLVKLAIRLGWKGLSRASV